MLTAREPLTPRTYGGVKARGEPGDGVVQGGRRQRIPKLRFSGVGCSELEVLADCPVEHMGILRHQGGVGGRARCADPS